MHCVPEWVDAARLTPPPVTGCACVQMDLMVQFKKIAADKRTEGKGKKKKEVVSVKGGGDDKISEEEFAVYFSKAISSAPRPRGSP